MESPFEEERECVHANCVSVQLTVYVRMSNSYAYVQYIYLVHIMYVQCASVIIIVWEV